MMKLLLLLVVAGAMTMPTPATAQFEIEVVAFQADGYVVTVDAGGPSLGPCPPLTCRRSLFYLRVTPCPPGTYCPDGQNGSLTITDPVQMTLEYGTNYVFTGDWVAESGPRIGFACTYTCSNTQPVAETTQRLDRDEVGQWVATPLEQDGANVWVQVDIASDYLNYGPCSDSCLRTDTRVVVSPCPIAARYHLPSGTVDLIVDCSGNQAEFITLPSPTPDPALDLLFAPGEYAIDGYWFTMFFGTQQGGGCGDVNCTFTAYPNPVTFSTHTLPVEETTWGRIKALYRN